VVFRAGSTGECGFTLCVGVSHILLIFVLGRVVLLYKI
jgi:hypothetical protein